MPCCTGAWPAKRPIEPLECQHTNVLLRMDCFLISVSVPSHQQHGDSSACPPTVTRFLPGYQSRITLTTRCSVVCFDWYASISVWVNHPPWEYESGCIVDHGGCIDRSRVYIGCSLRSSFVCKLQLLRNYQAIVKSTFHVLRTRYADGTAHDELCMLKRLQHNGLVIKVMVS
jgi:hypothetical protein